VVVRIADVFDPPASHEPHRHPIAPPAQGRRFRRWGVERPEDSYPFHVESDAPVPDASSAGEAWRALLALAAGLSLAVVSYAQFRGARGELPVSELTAALAPAAPLDTLDIDLAAVASEVVDAVAAPSPLPVERRRNDDRGALAAARRESAPRAESVLAEALPPEPIAASGIPEFDQLLDKARAKAPTRSLVSVDDVGVATAFLAHDAARLITGGTLYIDGGYHIMD
jgi:hypothetical protein